VERFELDMDGYKVHGSVTGAGERTLVCINAAQMTMGAWRGVASCFTDDVGYRLVLFDFPNQGKRATLESPQDANAQAAVTRAVIQHVSPGKPVDVLGCSWGSVIAAKYAATYPSTVRRLLLGSFHVVASERLRQFAPECLELIARDAKRDIANLFISTFGGGLSEEYCELIRKQFDGLTVGEMAQLRLQCEGAIATPDLRQHIDFDAITARILIANGADDPLIQESDNELTSETLPQAELRIIPGVGHFLHIQELQIVGEHYMPFLQRATGTFRIPTGAAGA
jgi:pimeloyl-ACP methyl ester carboxylesterase